MSKLPFDFEQYKNILGKRESTDNWKAKNRLGYLGRYQLGAPALIDAGLVKPGTTNKELKNPKNWTYGNMNVFLNSPTLQDKALEAYTQKNYRALQSKGMLDDGVHPGHVAGLLGASHLVGATGAEEALVKGKDVKDANNIKPQDYYSMLSTGFGLKQPSQPRLKAEPAPVQPQEFMKGSIEAEKPGMFESLGNELLAKVKGLF